MISGATGACSTCTPGIGGGGGGGGEEGGDRPRRSSGFRETAFGVSQRLRRYILLYSVFVTLFRRCLDFIPVCVPRLKFVYTFGVSQRPSFPPFPRNTEPRPVPPTWDLRLLAAACRRPTSVVVRFCATRAPSTLCSSGSLSSDWLSSSTSTTSGSLSAVRSL